MGTIKLNVVNFTKHNSLFIHVSHLSFVCLSYVIELFLLAIKAYYFSDVSIR